MFCVSGATKRSNDHFTVAALKGSPLWNLTPWRRWKSQVVSSGFSQEVASQGTILKFASRTTSWSYIDVCMPRMAWIWKGSVVVMSAPWAMVRVPLAAVAAAAVVGAGAAAAAVVAAGSAAAGAVVGFGAACAGAAVGCGGAGAAGVVGPQAASRP